VDGSGVVDGEVLLLDEGPAPDGPVAVDDVRDAIEDEVDRAGRFWRPPAALDLAAGGSAVAAAAAAGLVLWWGVAGTATVAGGGVLVLSGVAGGRWSVRAGRPGCAHLLVCVASGWGGLLAWLVAGRAGWSTATATLAAVGAAVAVCAAAVAVIAAGPGATRCRGSLGGLLAGHVVLAVAGSALGVPAILGADPRTSVRCVALGAVVALGLLPRLALALGGLPAADRAVRAGAPVGRDEVARRVRSTRWLLVGVVVGGAVTMLGAALVLAGSPYPADRALAGLLGLAVLLRSRLFSDPLLVAALRVTGLAGVGGAVAGTAVAEPPVRHWLTLLAAGGVLVMLASCGVQLAEVGRARLRRMLGWVEFVVAMLLVVAAAAALGVLTGAMRYAGLRP
jgi:hypothetical protein